jgi:hypothetical protein
MLFLPLLFLCFVALLLFCLVAFLLFSNFQQKLLSHMVDYDGEELFWWWPALVCTLLALHCKPDVTKTNAFFRNFWYGFLVIFCFVLVISHHALSSSPFRLGNVHLYMFGNFFPNPTLTLPKP